MVRSFAALVALAGLAACAPSIQPEAAPDIVGVWRLSELRAVDGTATVPPPDVPYEIRFAADGVASLRVDCNRATARWGSTSPNRSGQIGFEARSMTEAFCGEGSLDTRIVRQLPGLTRFSIRRDVLTLEGGEGAQVWVRDQ